MEKKKPSERKSQALKTIGTGAAIIVVASVAGVTPGPLAAMVLGAVLAITFT